MPSRKHHVHPGESLGQTGCWRLSSCRRHSKSRLVSQSAKVLLTAVQFRVDINLPVSSDSRSFHSAPPSENATALDACLYIITYIAGCKHHRQAQEGFTELGCQLLVAGVQLL